MKGLHDSADLFKKYDKTLLNEYQLGNSDMKAFPSTVISYFSPAAINAASPFSRASDCRPEENVIFPSVTIAMEIFSPLTSYFPLETERSENLSDGEE